MTASTSSTDNLGGLLTVSLDRLTEITSIPRTKLYEEIKSGKLKAVKMGRRTLVRVADARAWIDAAAAATAGA